jgi:hypothetical protein
MHHALSNHSFQITLCGIDDSAILFKPLTSRLGPQTISLVIDEACSDDQIPIDADFCCRRVARYSSYKGIQQLYLLPNQNYQPVFDPESEAKVGRYLT